MNKTLGHVIAEVARLPDHEQAAIARPMSREIAADKDWDERFARSEEKLANLAAPR